MAEGAGGTVRRDLLPGGRPQGRAAALAGALSAALADPVAAARALMGRLGEALEAEPDREALWLVVALGAGIGLYFALPAEPAGWTGPLLCLWLGLALACFRGRVGARRLVLLLLAAAIGLTVAQIRTWSVTAPVLAEDLARTDVTGRLVAVLGGEQGMRLLIAPESIDGVPAAALPERIRVTLRGSADGLWPGDRVRFPARLGPPSWPVAPGAYDFARAAFFQGVGATGLVLGRVTVLPRETGSLGDWAAAAIGTWRLDIARTVREALPGAPGAIAAALIAGDRSLIPEADLIALRDSSLAHLLSISGVHMTLVTASLFGLVRGLLALVAPVVLRFPIKKWAAAAALVGASLYLVLSGASIPTIRSYVMVALMLGAILVDRPALSLRVVALSAALVLLIMPESLLDPSFQMSYGAVAALVAAFEVWNGRNRTEERPLPGLVSRAGLIVGAAILTSLVAGLATGVFAIYHFGRLSTYGVAANLAATPVMGLLVMPAGMAALLLMPVGLEDLALVPMGWGIEVMLAIAREVASWPGSAVALPAWPAGALLLGVGGGLWLIIWRRTWRLMGLGAIAAALVWADQAPRPEVLIAEQGANIAARGPEGRLALATGRAGFVTQSWLARDGDDRSPRAARGGLFTCTRTLCEAEIPGPGRTWRLAYVLRPEGWASACAGADIVVAPIEAHPCVEPTLVLDGPWLARAGGVTITLGPQGPHLRTVAEVRGNRPWTGPVRQ